MLQSITITREDILHQVKLSLQIPESIEQIVTRKLIIATAEEVGIKVEAQELQQAADKMRLMNKLNGADETWVWLKQRGMSLDDFEEVVYYTVIADKLANHLFADHVEAYFYEHQLDYTGAVMYEIVLDDEDLAMELFYAVSEGEMSFYDVAHQYIQDIELRRTGGYRGLVRRLDLKPDISAAVFAATPPQVLKPIVTSKGVHLILVDELIQLQLDDYLRQKIRAQFFVDWIKEEINKVEVNQEL